MERAEVLRTMLSVVFETRFSRFLFVGAFLALLDTVLFVVINQAFFGWEAGRLFETRIVTFVLMIPVSLYIHNRLTFRSTQTKVSPQTGAKFVVFNILFLGLSFIPFVALDSSEYVISEWGTALVNAATIAVLSLARYVTYLSVVWADSSK